MTDTPLTDAIWKARRPDSPSTAAAELDSHARRMERERNELRAAAQDVVDRWDTPFWKDVPATANFINRLRAALAKSTT